MKKTNIFISLCSLCFLQVSLLPFFLFSSCSYGVEEVFARNDNVKTRTGDLKVFPTPNSLCKEDLETKYTVAIITDVHFNRESQGINATHKEVEDMFLRWLLDMSVQDRPRFVLCLGDVTEHGLSREYAMYADFVSKIEDIDTGEGKMKVYGTIGNHDLLNNGYIEYEKFIMSDTFFCFFSKNFSWYLFDTGTGTMGTSQYEKLINAMKKDPRPKILATHYPLYAGGASFCCLSDTTERNLLLHYFAKYNAKALFVGHSHTKNFCDMGRFEEYNIPGFLDKGKWAVATIDENSMTVQVRIAP